MLNSQVALIKENTKPLARLCILDIIYTYIMKNFSKKSRLEILNCVFSSERNRNADKALGDNHIVPATKRILTKVCWARS